MTRTEVKTFINAGISALGITYGAGRVSEFNSERMHSYPKIWLEPLEKQKELVNVTLPMDTYRAKLHIAKQDAIDSTPEDYETLVDECDLIADELVQKYNEIVSGYRLITLSGITISPFIKKNADCLTGVVLEMTIQAPNQTNFC